jgi:ssDNA-binding Zn-finger/Zn-ribbon topoisomerase 1
MPLPEEAAKIAELEAKTKDERCPICGKTMEVKRGRFGYFLGCSDYPKCKGISKIWNKTGFKCPNCAAKLQDEQARTPLSTDGSPSTNSGQSASSKLIGDVVEKKGRGRGKPFYACTRWPDCEFIVNIKPESETQLQDLYKQWLENKDKPKTAKKTTRKTSKKTSA